MLVSAAGRGLSRGCFEKYLNIFTPSSVHRSIIPQANSTNAPSVTSETFGFTRLMGLSPEEVSFLANSSFLEKLMFAMSTQDRRYFYEAVDLMDVKDGDIQIERGKVSAVIRMLLTPGKSASMSLRRKFATGPKDAPFESLVVDHEDRFMSNISLLHSTYTYIPQSRAPPVTISPFLVSICYGNDIMSC